MPTPTERSPSTCRKDVGLINEPRLNATFSSWGAAPSATEQTKCENAERAVRKAIDASSKLAPHTIEVFTQGSYANRTNVRQDSDVDICVLYKDVFFTDYTLSEALNDSAVGLSTASYKYADFKNDVEAALISHFGGPSVTRGKKAFYVHVNTYRIDADVVLCFEHRRYMEQLNTTGMRPGRNFTRITAAE